MKYAWKRKWEGWISKEEKVNECKIKEDKWVVKKIKRVVQEMKEKLRVFNYAEKV